MKVLNITKLDQKFIQCDIQTETKNFFVKQGDEYALVHNSPSVVIHSENGDYWVGSKSVFAKDAKLNRTDADIEANHGHAPGLVEKLKYALKYCKSLGIKGTVQGDFLYTDSDLETRNIDGINHVIFQPNTITYAVPVESDLGKKILSSKMGIILHTYYEGDSLENMSAKFGYSVSKLKQNKDVFFDDANIKDATSAMSITKEEQSIVNDTMKVLLSVYNSIDKSFLEYISNHKEISTFLAKFNNANVRAGDYTGKKQAKQVSSYIHKEYQKEIDKLKTEKGKASKDASRVEILTYLEKHLSELEKAYEAFTCLVTLKSIIVKKLNSTAKVGTFIFDGEKFKATTPEGFVAVNSKDNRVVKLVDRLEFSRQNMVGGKFGK